MIEAVYKANQHKQFAMDNHIHELAFLLLVKNYFSSALKMREVICSINRADIEKKSADSKSRLKNKILIRSLEDRAILKKNQRAFFLRHAFDGVSCPSFEVTH